jgi:hypothetical protein
MNKQISTGVGIAIIVIIALIIGMILWAKSVMFQTPTQNAVPAPVKNSMTNNQQGEGQKTKEQSCLSSGGTISTASCCGQTQDFPNSCLIGACGCSPTSSHQVKTCSCGAGKCFDGNVCVSR